MSPRSPDKYDLDSHIAEIYDQEEDHIDDVEFLRRLLGQRSPLRILEPFCGTGRILIPLAQDGHELIGFDRAQGMLDRAAMKIARLPEEVRRRITLHRADVLTVEWPGDCDLVILGANCLYEFGSAEDQEQCIRSAAKSLREGGFLFVDNNCRRGRVSKEDLEWRGNFPTGTCADGTRIESHCAIVGIEPEKNLWMTQRSLRIISKSGEERGYETTGVTHPVSMEEVCYWLNKNGFVVLALYGNRLGAPFTADDRAIFWAQMAR